MLPCGGCQKDLSGISYKMEHILCWECYEKWKDENKIRESKEKEDNLKIGTCKKCGLESKINKAEICFPCHESLAKEDIINKPNHYHSGGIDPIEYGEHCLTKEEMNGFYKMNVIKYVSRSGKKDDILQDLKKAKFYLDKLVSIYGG